MSTLNGGPFDGMSWTGARDPVIYLTRDIDRTHHRYEFDPARRRYLYVGVEQSEGGGGTKGGTNGGEAGSEDVLSADDF